MTQLDLSQFKGTEAYYRYSPLFPKVVLTDGTKYLADQAGAFWLMDMIASHTTSITDYFAIASLTKGKTGAKFMLTDDVPPNVTYAKQAIEYTDFPLPEIKLYVIKQDDLWVVLLPSEW